MRILSVKSYTSELLSWCDANILWRQQFFWCSKVFSWCSNSFPGAAKFSGSELWFSGFSKSLESFPSWRQWFFLHGSCICIVACEKCDFFRLEKKFSGKQASKLALSAGREVFLCRQEVLSGCELCLVVAW